MALHGDLQLPVHHRQPDMPASLPCLPQYVFRETIDLGHTTKSKQEIKVLLHKLKLEWQEWCRGVAGREGAGGPLSPLQM